VIKADGPTPGALDAFRRTAVAGAVLVNRYRPTSDVTIVMRNYRVSMNLGFSRHYLDLRWIDAPIDRIVTWPLEEVFRYFRVATPLEALATTAPA